jgi:hypothetical protein
MIERNNNVLNEIADFKTIQFLYKKKSALHQYHKYKETLTKCLAQIHNLKGIFFENIFVLQSFGSSSYSDLQL